MMFKNKRLRTSLRRWPWHCWLFTSSKEAKIGLF